MWMASSWKGKSEQWLYIWKYASLITKEIQISFKSHMVEEYLEDWTKPSLDQKILLGLFHAAGGITNW